MIKLTKEISGRCEENSSISAFPSMQYKQNRIWMQMEHVYIYTVFIIAMFSNISALEMCTVDHCGHKKFKIFPKKYWPKWSDQMIKYIFQTLIILANMVWPFWPPQKLLDFTTVIMVWLNLPAKIQTEYFFTFQKSLSTLVKNLSGDPLILRSLVTPEDHS